MGRLQSAETNLLILGVLYVNKIEITNQTAGVNVLDNISKLKDRGRLEHDDNEHADRLPEQVGEQDEWDFEQTDEWTWGENQASVRDKEEPGYYGENTVVKATVW